MKYNCQSALREFFNGFSQFFESGSMSAHDTKQRFVSLFHNLLQVIQLSTEVGVFLMEREHFCFKWAFNRLLSLKRLSDWSNRSWSTQVGYTLAP
jgi:hypothetical protein